MKRIFKVAMLLAIIPVLLIALSFKTAEARTNVSRCQLCQSHFIPQSGSQAYKTLYGVAAVSANDIWGVGSSSLGNTSPTQTLIEHWNGTSWSIVKSPSPGTASNSLNGVAAVSTSNVWAVGTFANSFSSSQTLIEHWNGTKWSVVKSPNPSGSTNNTLNGIAMVSTSDIWAVGYSANSNTGIESTLIEHWNGTRWSIVKSPNPSGSMYNAFGGIAAVSTSDIWAVGTTITNASSSTLIEHWNGTQWSIASSPNPGSNYNKLNEVAAVSANDIWAVGEFVNGNTGPKTLIEHWNGTQWSVVQSPAPGVRGSSLSGVAAVSANDVWASGGSYTNSASPTLIEHWNGTQWSVVKSPNPPHTTNNTLVGIAMVSHSDIWAVGYSTANNTGIGATLIEHWNGTKWSIIKSPATENHYRSLN